MCKSCQIVYFSYRKFAMFSRVPKSKENNTLGFAGVRALWGIKDSPWHTRYLLNVAYHMDNKPIIIFKLCKEIL